MVRRTITEFETGLLHSGARPSLYGSHEIFVAGSNIQREEISPEALAAKLLVDLVWLYYLVCDSLEEEEMYCYPHDIARRFAVLMTQFDSDNTCLYRNASSLDEVFLVMISWIDRGGSEEAYANAAILEETPVAPLGPDRQPLVVLSQGEVANLLDGLEKIAATDSRSSSQTLYFDENIFRDEESRAEISFTGSAAASFLVVGLMSDIAELKENGARDVHLDTHSMVLCFEHLLNSLNEMATDKLNRQDEVAFRESLFTTGLDLLSNRG